MATALEKRLNTLEAQVRILKRTARRGVDPAIDEKTWQKVKPVAKRVRAKLYRERYG